MVGRARRQRLCAEGSVREGCRHLGIISEYTAAMWCAPLRSSAIQDIQRKREQAAKRIYPIRRDGCDDNFYSRVHVPFDGNGK